MISADVGADGLLEGLRLNPRALRLGSEMLAGHIVAAVRAAQENLSDQIGESAADSATAGGLEPAALVRRLDEVEDQAAQNFTRLTATLDETLRRLEGR